MTLDSGEVTKIVLNTIFEQCHKLGMKLLRKDDRIIIFLDEQGDNIMIWKPETVCTPCIHDPVEQLKKREELKI